MDKIDVLLELAEKGTLYKKQKVTTTDLSKKLNSTQQTMSNILKRLEDEGFIIREHSLKGLTIIITKKGKQFLMNHKKRLDSIFEKINRLEGKVTSGLGEGKFYIRQEGYMKKFKELLDIEPYPGTLNIIVHDAEKNRFLGDKNPILIPGFETKDRTFGPIEAYPIKIKNINAAIIIPKRTHHDEEVVEIIAEKNLRIELKIKDKDEVVIDDK